MKRGHDVATATNLPDLFANAGLSVAMAGPAKLKRKKQPKPAPVDGRFTAFHAANPGVFAEIERRALAAQASGAKRISVFRIFGDMRDDLTLKTRGEEYNLNNSFVPLYARRLLDAHPELGNLIELRARKKS